MRPVFISYRREDTEGQAGRLFQELREEFGPEAVFMDVATIEPGVDFRRVIEKNTAACGALLAVIGRHWLSAKDKDGRRRLDDPHDFVRLETAAALRRDIPVIPVLVQDASMVRADDLPDELKELAFRNAVEISHARWDSDVQLLIKALRPLVAANNHTQPPATNKWRPALIAGGVALFVGGVFASIKLLSPSDDTNTTEPNPSSTVPATVEVSPSESFPANEETGQTKVSTASGDAQASAPSADSAAESNTATDAQALAEQQAQALRLAKEAEQALAAARAEQERLAAERAALEEQGRITAAELLAAREQAEREAIRAAEANAAAERERELALKREQELANERAQAQAREAAARAHDAGICIDGFVWREARSGDIVCVTPNVRSRTAEENALAESRRQPGGGAYGPNTCMQGFVWREAFEGDVVCVDPRSREQARQDNAAAQSRVVSAQPVDLRATDVPRPPTLFLQ